LFVDIRDSFRLPDLYKRPALAKLYRAYISDMVAIMNGHAQAREIRSRADGTMGGLGRRRSQATLF
jgi:hypothetical protein